VIGKKGRSELVLEVQFAEVGTFAVLEVLRLQLRHFAGQGVLKRTVHLQELQESHAVV
jgi:hypothetical protein